MKRASTIYLVGAGPGAADLLTVRALAILEKADVVLYDRLVAAEVLARARAGAILVNVGKEEGEQEATQTRIFHLLEHYAHRYRHVVRLKGGDPFVFGRGGEEWAWLQSRGWRVEVVPGVSSALAVPALAGIPPTHRHLARGFAVVAGQTCGDNRQCWARYAEVDTLIILMGVHQRATIAQALIAAGRPATQPVCFVENGTTPRERILVSTLGAVARGETDVASPAVFVVGEVVRLRERMLALIAQAIA